MFQVNTYKLERDLPTRINEYKRIRDITQTKVPVIIIVDQNIETEKKYYKFLIEGESRICNLIGRFKEEMQVSPLQSLYFMSDSKDLVNVQKSLSVVYYEHKDALDYLLYLYVYKENTFGTNRSKNPGNFYTL